MALRLALILASITLASIFITGKAVSNEIENPDSSLIMGVLDAIQTPEPSKGKKTPQSLGDTIQDFVVVYDTPNVQINVDVVTEDIVSMVKTFYGPKPDEKQSLENVLGFLENAYSEHDYYESGNWEPRPNKYRQYIPFQGELPSYTDKDFISPVSGRLTSGYGYRAMRHRQHYGVDIALNIGDTVKCVLPGVVTKIGYERGGYGHYIVVTHHGDLETIYAHLSRTIAVPGQKVGAGTVIGLGGSTGNSTGPHLHFETRFRGMPVNPFSWFPKL